jgi:hypothetical protein
VFSINFRPAAALVAVAAIAVCAACGSSTDSKPATSSSAAATSTAHIADCDVKAPGPSSVDGAFKDVPGFTVDHLCPTDVDKTLGTQTAEFLAVNAGKVSADGNPVLSVFAGQLKSGAGDLFVRTFLDGVGSRAAPKTLATESKKVGKYSVTHFTVPSDGNGGSGVDGYAYFEGPTVVIAYNLAGEQKTDSAEDALAKVLGNVFTGQ